MVEKDTRIQIYEQLTHDIKSPITALKLASHEMREDNPVSNILKIAVKRIEGIVKSSHKLDRDASNGLSIISVKSLLENIFQEKELYAKPIGIKLKTDLKVGSQIKIKARPHELERIVSNLINNAIEASNKSSEIRTSVYTREENLIIEIQDQGCGIAKENIKKITERGASFNKKEGSGLGLYHAKKKTRRMGRKALYLI